MKVVTPGQMNMIDTAVIDKVGLPGVVLMENAALRVMSNIKKRFKGIKNKNIVVLAGKGNNGGDAFAVARHLFNEGGIVNVYVLAAKDDLKGDAELNHSVLVQMGVRVLYFTDANILIDMDQCIFKSDIIVDGIFGTGFKGEISGMVEKVINMANKSGAFIVSIDIPSGVDGETGKVSGASINASVTVTFGFPKIGHFMFPGCDCIGELLVEDISIPKKVSDSVEIKVNAVDRDMAVGLIPKRRKDANKGSFGKVFIVTGSEGMTGAGCLAGSAALRCGSGLLYLGVPETLAGIYESVFLESVTIPLKDNGKGCLSEDCIDRIQSMLSKVDVVAVGPGLSTSSAILGIVSQIIKNSSVPVVLDADALNSVAKDISVLKNRKAELVLTPHPGEMARLTGRSVGEIQNDRIGIAREFAVNYEVVVVLKGFRTIVATPSGEVFINLTGNSGMATAGTGDVLTGVIASLIGQGLTPRDAAVLGVYLHGFAGDNAAFEKGENGIIASDLVNELPYVLNCFISKWE